MMKNPVFYTLLLFLVYSCSETESPKSQQGENDVDAATMFIRSALDGRWKDAKKLVVQDSANIEGVEAFERSYTERMNVSDQRGYRESQITVHDTRKLNDSTSIVVYSNTYKKQRDSVKVVRINNQWLVDFKFTAFNPSDSTNK